MPVDPMMDAHAKTALNATKALHKRLRELDRDNIESDGHLYPTVNFPALKKLAAEANRAIQAMQRHASDEVVRADVRENLLREAVRDELIDREANAARVLDRQRTLMGVGTGGLAAVHERALQSAGQIGASIDGLCPYASLRRAPGVDRLARRSTTPHARG